MIDLKIVFQYLPLIDRKLRTHKWPNEAKINFWFRIQNGNNELVESRREKIAQLTFFLFICEALPEQRIDFWNQAIKSLKSVYQINEKTLIASRIEFPIYFVYEESSFFERNGAVLSLSLFHLKSSFIHFVLPTTESQ